MTSLLNKVTHLLFHSGVSGYRISKDTHVAQSAIVKYRNKRKPVTNLYLGTAEKLGAYDDKIRTNK